jgi:hypothetical protein
MINHKLLLMIPAFIFSFSVYAYDPADGNITVTAGPFVYKTIFPDADFDTGVVSGYHGDFGLIGNGDLDEKSSIEIGIFHMNKLFYRDENGKVQVEQTQVMHISMGYRRWLNPYLSGGLGLYSGYPMDDTKVVHTDFAPGAEIDTSARDKTEYGFDVSVQCEVWQNDTLSAVFDARYIKSMTSKENEFADHYGFMLGLRYLFQEKRSVKKEDNLEKEIEPRDRTKLEKEN